LFIPPENEGLLISSAPEVAAVSGATRILIEPELQNSYEVGIQQGVKNWFKVDAAYYTKDVRNTQDNDQFLNTGLLFPVSFAGAKLKGFDLRADIPNHHGFTGYVSFGTNSAIFSPPATGGLFSDFPESNFRID